jgi:hypothetical protein
VAVSEDADVQEQLVQINGGALLGSRRDPDPAVHDDVRVFGRRDATSEARRAVGR